MPRLKEAYMSQKKSAEIRGIKWKFTFKSWLKVWEDSGHLHERGPRSHQYVMARNGDRGPYSPKNVRIITARENHQEYIVTPEARQKQSAARKGKKRPEHGKKISAIQLGKPHPHKGGWHHSKETKLKLSRMRKGKTRPPFSIEHKRKLSLAGRGRKHSGETKDKISVARKLYWYQKRQQEGISL